MQKGKFLTEHLILLCAPSLYYPEHLKFPVKNTSQNIFFTEQFPVAVFPNVSYFFRKAKTETIFHTSSVLDMIEVL